jgi:hypothetical protein
VSEGEYQQLEDSWPQKIQDMNDRKITPQALCDFQKSMNEAGEKAKFMIPKQKKFCDKHCKRHHKEVAKLDNCFFWGDFRNQGQAVRVHEDSRWPMLKQLIGGSNPGILREWVPGIKVDVKAEQPTPQIKPAGQVPSGSAASSLSAADLAGYNLYAVQ